MFFFSRSRYISQNISDPGIKPGSPALQADSLLFELPGKPSQNTKESKSQIRSRAEQTTDMRGDGCKSKRIYTLQRKSNLPSPPDCVCCRNLAGGHGFGTPGVDRDFH